MDLKNTQEPNYHKVDNILQLNEDCLLQIMQYFSLIELCNVAETCQRLQNIAQYEFMRQKKCYAIPHIEVNFKDHPRILRNFGSLIDNATIIDFPGLPLSRRKRIVQSFYWLEKYCNTLQELTVVKDKDIVLPPSAKRLMVKLKKIKLYSPISHEIVRNALLKCKNLVELNILMYDGPFIFTDHHFPHLRELSHRVRVNHDTEFHQMKTFFQKHPNLIALDTQFLTDGVAYTIDLSFIAYLVNLEKLGFILYGAEIIGINVFANLKKLKELSIDNSNDMSTDIEILESLASIDSLVKLELGLSEIDHLITGIGRFKNLSELTISQHILPPFHPQFNTNISGLAQLKNSPLTNLNIKCNKLLEPKTIVDVISNLKELRVMKCLCEIELSERLLERLVTVCSSQRRKLEIILDEELFEDIDVFDKFNKRHGQIVEIKTV